MHDFAIMLSIFIAIYCFLDNIFKISDKITIKKSQDKNPANDSFLPYNSLSLHTYPIIISILFCIFTLYTEGLMGGEAYRNTSRLQRPKTFHSRTKSDDLEKTSGETDDEKYKLDQKISIGKKCCKFCHHHPNEEKCRYCRHNKLRSIDKEVCKHCKHVRNEPKFKLEKSDEVDGSREDSDYVKPTASPFFLKIGSKLFGSISKERTDDFEDEEIDNRNTTYKKKRTHQYLETEETPFFLEIGDLFSPASEEAEIISPMDVESESGEEMPDGIEEEDVGNMDASGLDEQVDENIENIAEPNLDEQPDISELENPEANLEVYEQGNLEQEQILNEQQMAGNTGANGMQVNSFMNAQPIPQPQMVQQLGTIQTQNPGNIYPQVSQETKLAIIQRFQNANIQNIKDFLNKLPNLLQQTPMNELRALTEYCFVPLFRKLPTKDMENLLGPSTYYYLIGRSDNELIETFTNILEGLHPLPYASIKAFCDSHAAGYEQGTMAVDTYSLDMVVEQAFNRLKEMGILNEESVNMASKGYRISRCLMCSSEKFMNVLSGDASNGLCDSCLSKIRRANGSGGNLIDSLRGRSENSRNIGGILGDVLDSSIDSSNGRIDIDGRNSTYSSGRHGQAEAENDERIRSSGEYSSSKGSSNGEGNLGKSLVEKGVEFVFDKLSGKDGSSTSDGNTTSGQMVLDASGNLVPAGSTPGAPYGYIKDPVTGQMRPATSAQEAASAVATTRRMNGMGGGIAGQMVLDASGNLVPAGSTPGAPYGYIKDPVTGQMRPATSAQEAASAVAITGRMSGMGAMNGMGGGIAGQMVRDANGNLVPAGSIPGAPYGYIRDPMTGQMRPARSAQEAASAVAAIGGLGTVGKTAGIIGTILNSNAVGNTVSGIANVASSIASAIGNVGVAKANNAMYQGAMNQNGIAGQNGGAGTSSNTFTQAAAGATNAASTAANGQNGSASGTNNSTATNQQNAAAKQTSAQAQAAAQSEANQAAAAQRVAAAAQESASKKRRRKQR